MRFGWRTSGWGVWLFVLSGVAARAQWLIPPAGYAVQGAPFSATVRKEWTGLIDTQPGEQTYRIEHDGAGRQRYEINLNGELVVTIYDPVAGRVITERGPKTFVRQTRVGKVMVADPAGPPQRCGLLPGWTAFDPEMIAGQEACHDKQGGRELWRSRTYRMPLKSVTDDGKLGTVTQTVVQFVAGEPDPALFALPDGPLIELPAADLAEPPDVGSAQAKEGAGPDGSRLRQKAFDAAPIALYTPEPEFTDEARRAGVNGSVLVALKVGLDGKPQDVRVIRGVGLGLDEKAAEAVRQYRFKPAMKDGKPVTIEMNVMVNFTIFKSH